MAPSTLEQFIRFGTDAAAMERMLRMFQSIIMVVVSSPLLLEGFGQLVVLGNTFVWTNTRTMGVVVLQRLRDHVSIARRFFRMFRFLESFYAAHQLYTSLYSGPESKDGSKQAVQASQLAQTPAPAQTTPVHQHHPNCRHGRKPGPPTEVWLDIFGRTFNGMYLLLETLCLVDALQLPGFSLWGEQWFRALFVEGQRFWFFGLVCGVASGLVKIVKLLAYAPVPPTGEGYGTGEKKDESEMADWEKERERLRRVMWVRKEQRKLWRANIRSKSKGLVRKCVADLLDMVMPGSIVGWWKVDQGILGFILIITTYLTGLEVWDRCGRELEGW